MVISTGSRPRIPEWADPDGIRVLTTRQAYPPPELPEHLVVVGSGVTGVEFVHMFSSLGSKVTLIVSRQHVLPHKDAEVAAALEDELLRRGVQLFKGARAVSLDKTGGGRGGPVRRRPGGPGEPRFARRGLGAQLRAARPRAGGREGRQMGLRNRSTSIARQMSPTSTRPAMSQENCRFLRWPPCRDVRWPST